MTLIVPDVELVRNLTDLLTPSLSLKLYRNNATPSAASVLASFTEVSGGGYAAKTLTFATWDISTDGIATYEAQDFTFTSATDAPGTIYGYYITEGSNLVWAERFPSGVLPFSPVNGTLIRITPRIVASS